MKKLLGILAILLTIGVSLTLYLPEYQPNDTSKPAMSKASKSKIRYQINQDSLKQPIKMSDILLAPTTPSDSTFGVRLGLYSQLKQAIDFSANFNTEQPLTIVKAQDNFRQWYLVITGPFASQIQGEQIQQQLFARQISATLIQWPLAIESDSKESDTKDSK